MSKQYRWYDGSTGSGVEDTLQAAMERLALHVDWDLQRGIIIPPIRCASEWDASSDTYYFYASQSEADADIDGAYAAQISEFGGLR